jgi:thiol:disulfide interchange protein DsbC
MRNRPLVKVGLLSALALVMTGCFEDEAVSAVQENQAVKEETAENKSEVTTEATALQVEKAKEDAIRLNSEVSGMDVTSHLKRMIPQAQISSVSESPISGVYAVEVLGNGTIYMSGDGQHFIAGDLYRIGQDRIANVTEERMNVDRAKALLAVDKSQMITYPAQGEEKAKLTVFTDIDCGYCRKFHQEVPELNDLGISISYMAFPRAGVGSGSFNKYVSVWCSDDQKRSMDKAKGRIPVESKSCTNPVADQYLLGQQVGINSTPNLVTESGELIRGYVPAKELASRLGIN